MTDRNREKGRAVENFFHTDKQQIDKQYSRRKKKNRSDRKMEYSTS